MTINQYLCLPEALKLRYEKADEKYLRLLERASSPAAARIDPTGLSRPKNYRNTHESLLLELSDASAACDKAWIQYRTFRDNFEKTLDKLEYRERLALEQIYIWNMGKPPEKRRVGVCRWCHCRTKKEAAVLIRQAKQHLTEILITQGIEIRGNNEQKSN